ncbi:hypothetical protein ACOME3_005519 [Neoechinorhynchus agilis]
MFSSQHKTIYQHIEPLPQQPQRFNVGHRIPANENTIMNPMFGLNIGKLSELRRNEKPCGGKIVHSVHYFELDSNDPRDAQPRVLQRNGATEVYVPVQRRRRHPRFKGNETKDRFYTDIPDNSDHSIEDNSSLCSIASPRTQLSKVQYKNYTTKAVQTAMSKSRVNSGYIERIYDDQSKVKRQNSDIHHYQFDSIHSGSQRNERYHHYRAAAPRLTNDFMASIDSCSKSDQCKDVVKEKLNDPDFCSTILLLAEKINKLNGKMGNDDGHKCANVGSVTCELVDDDDSLNKFT